MRDEKPGWCKPRKSCEACKEIDDSGLSYQDHSCGEKPARAPRGAYDALTGGRP
jgi:hypothetical protein